MGMIGVAERQLSNLAVRLPEGTTLTTIDPVVDVVGLFEVEPGLLRINRDYGWLRAADVLAEGDAGIVADVAAGSHAIAEAAPRGVAPRGVALARRPEAGRQRRDPRPRPRAEAACARPRRAAQATRLPGPRRLRDLVDRVRGAHGAPPRPACPRARRPDPPDPAPRPGRLRRSGRPASRGGGTARRGRRRWRARARSRTRRSSRWAPATPGPGRRSSARRSPSGS